MAYIIPNSTLEVFEDMGLSPSHDDTLYFATTADKDAYFGDYVKKRYTSLSYQRHARNVVRVQAPMSDLYNKAYLRFKNSSFENKWFYAFITNVEYINNETTQITYELDVIMTWMGSFELKECFIDRQHVTNDSIGANIADEGLGVGEYVCEGTYSPPLFTGYSVAFYKTYNPSKDSEGLYPVKQGTYVPLISNFYDISNSTAMTQLTDRINALVGNNRGEEILQLKLVPNHWTNPTSLEPVSDPYNISKPYTSIGGYTNVRNKKLFCYPYKYLEGHNSEGKSVQYKYEYFGSLPDDTSSGNASFVIKGTSCTPEVNIMCTPTNYNGKGSDYENSLTMENFPNIAWNVDGYKAYLAQRDSTLFGNAITDVLMGGFKGALAGAGTGFSWGGGIGGKVGAIVGGASGMLSSGISSAKPLISDTLNSMRDDLPSRAPVSSKGNPSSNLMVQDRTKNFYFRQMCITKNYAEMLDDYFDMYGYAVKQHGVPNMNARPNWTYVKTIGCVVHGNLPSSDAKDIEDIFDHGVRFWKNHNQIGNYSADNSPV